MRNRGGFLAGVLASAVFAFVASAYGGGGGDASLGRVKANFVRVLRDTNALVYSEIAKMGGVPPLSWRTSSTSGSWRRHMGSMPDQRAAGRVFEITIPHGVKPSAASCAWCVRPCASRAP